MPLSEGVGSGARVTTAADWTATGAPTWLRAIFILGPTAAIAIYLVWVGANQMPAIAAQTRQTHVEIVRTREMLAEFIQQQHASNRMLTWICVHGAKDDNDRKNCFEK